MRKAGFSEPNFRLVKSYALWPSPSTTAHSHSPSVSPHLSKGHSHCCLSPCQASGGGHLVVGSPACRESWGAFLSALTHTQHTNLTFLADVWSSGLFVGPQTWRAPSTRLLKVLRMYLSFHSMERELKSGKSGGFFSPLSIVSSINNIGNLGQLLNYIYICLDIKTHHQFSMEL